MNVSSCGPKLHKRFREFRTPFLLRVICKNPRSILRACVDGDGAICSKNRKNVPYHGASPNTRNGARLCTSQIEASTFPPGQPPGHLNFWKICVQIPPSRGRKAVQMLHHKSIPDDQMPPPPENFSVAFIMLRKLCM